jgi:hypothetical protein
MEKKAVLQLKAKTGRTLDEWIAAVKKRGGKTRAAQIAWLKKEGLGTNYAGWIAAHAAGEAFDYDPDALVEAMFAGRKAALRPIYDALLDLGMKLGKDVTATPCATMVPLRRKYVFAQIKPTTLTRIDLGFALGDSKTPNRLIATGGLEKGDRITHRIPITSLDDIDGEVKKWLKAAYDRDA